MSDQDYSVVLNRIANAVERLAYLKAEELEGSAPEQHEALDERMRTVRKHLHERSQPKEPAKAGSLDLSGMLMPRH